MNPTPARRNPPAVPSVAAGMNEDDVTEIYRNGPIELRLGRWQEVLADVGACDAVITDPPYGDRIHEGQRHGRVGGNGHEWATNRGLGYGSLSPADVREFCASWAPRTSGWFCAMTSHDLVPHYEHALRKAGRYVFKPLPIVMIGMNVRLAGDGPSSWSVDMVQAAPEIEFDHDTTGLVVTRPRANARWGTLRGAYVGNPFDPGENTATASRRRSVVGAKPVWLLRALVRDYTRPDDLVVDPYSGGCTTGIACAIEGRRFIGAECDPETFKKAVKRLSAGWTKDMFSGG